MWIDTDAVEFPPLWVPHASKCRTPSHPASHCYRERELEDRVVENLAASTTLQIERQPFWQGIGIPDVVTWDDAPAIKRMTIFELKAVPINRAAVDQLAYYVSHARRWADREPEVYEISGVLVAFRQLQAALPHWLSFRQVYIEGDQ